MEKLDRDQLIELRSLARDRDRKAELFVRLKAAGISTVGERVRCQLELLNVEVEGSARESAPCAADSGGDDTRDCAPVQNVEEFPRINYVVATYDGVMKRTHRHPPPAEVLSRHLEHIISLQHNLAAVTVTKAQCAGKRVPGYYSVLPKLLANPLLRIVEVDNFGYSMGQLRVSQPCYRGSALLMAALGSTGGSKRTSCTATSSTTTSSWRMTMVSLPTLANNLPATLHPTRPSPLPSSSPSRTQSHHLRSPAVRPL